MSEINMDRVKYAFGKRLDSFMLDLALSKQYSKKYILELALATLAGIAKAEGLSEDEIIHGVTLHKGNLPVGES